MIDKLREDIDRIDNQLVDLFKERMEVSSQIAEYKRKNKLPVKDTERERQLLYRISDRAGELGGYSKILFTTIMDLSRSYQNKKLVGNSSLCDKIHNAVENTEKLFPQRARVACQGIEGAYSQKACDKIFALSDIKNSQTEAISCGSTNLRCGIVSIISSLEKSSSKFSLFINSVSTHPGLIILTVILSCASSNAKDFVKPINDAFVIE